MSPGWRTCLISMPKRLSEAWLARPACQWRGFYGMNFVSAVPWATPHVMMGVVVGASLTVLGAIASRLLAVVLLIPLLLVLAVWLTLGAVRWLSQATVRLLEPVRNLANGRDTWLRRQILSLLDPQRPEMQGLIALGASSLQDCGCFSTSWRTSSAVSRWCAPTGQCPHACFNYCSRCAWSLLIEL